MKSANPIADVIGEYVNITSVDDPDDSEDFDDDSDLDIDCDEDEDEDEDEGFEPSLS